MDENDDFDWNLGDSDFDRSLDDLLNSPLFNAFFGGVLSTPYFLIMPFNQNYGAGLPPNYKHLSDEKVDSLIDGMERKWRFFEGLRELNNLVAYADTSEGTREGLANFEADRKDWIDWAYSLGRGFL